MNLFQHSPDSSSTVCASYRKDGPATRHHLSCGWVEDGTVAVALCRYAAIPGWEDILMFHTNPATAYSPPDFWVMPRHAAAATAACLRLRSIP